MGFSSGSACFPTQAEAALDWCNHLDTGAYALSCTGCAGTSCTVSYLNAGGTYGTIAKVVGQSACTVPDPVGDAVAYSGAVIVLWVAVAAAMLVVRFFRSPHVNAD